MCEVGIASYTKFVNGVWIDAGKVDNSSQGKSHGGGGCQDDSRFDFGDPSTILGGCRIQVSASYVHCTVDGVGMWALLATSPLGGQFKTAVVQKK